jgi:hypothetical protein
MATAHLSPFLRRLARGMAAETLVDQSDRQLIEQFLARRDEAVFEALLRRHGPMVYRVCWCRELPDAREPLSRATNAAPGITPCGPKAAEHQQHRIGCLPAWSRR